MLASLPTVIVQLQSLMHTFCIINLHSGKGNKANTNPNTFTDQCLFSGPWFSFFLFLFIYFLFAFICQVLPSSLKINTIYIKSHGSSSMFIWKCSYERMLPLRIKLDSLPEGILLSTEQSCLLSDLFNIVKPQYIIYMKSFLGFHEWTSDGFGRTFSTALEKA